MSRASSDEHYIIDLCDKILKQKASRGHRFPFLLGDASLKTGKKRTLPVDAYYHDIQLVIEYQERQHTESVKLFNKPTATGVMRDVQRRVYDDRRLEILPQHGINIVILDYTTFKTKNKKLLRDSLCDEHVLREKLAQFIRCPSP
jgi:hypothetical protein